MLRRAKFRIAALACAVTMAIGGVAASQASAQPLFTGGLVNVTLVDVVDINNNNVIAQVPIGVAANVCIGNVSVLDLINESTQTGRATCTADVTQLPRAFQP